MNIIGAFCLGFICGVVFLWVLILKISKFTGYKQNKILIKDFKTKK